MGDPRGQRRLDRTRRSGWRQPRGHRGTRRSVHPQTDPTPRRQLVLVGPGGDAGHARQPGRLRHRDPDRERTRRDRSRGPARRLEKHSARPITAIMQGADQTWRIRIDTATKQRQVLLSRLTQDQLRTVLGTLFDEQALLSPHGLRSLSQRFTSQYTVAEVRERRSATNRPSSARRCMAGTTGVGRYGFRSTISRSGRCCSMPTSSWTTSPSSTRRDRGTCGRCERSPTSWPTAWWAPGCRIRRGGRRPLNGGNTTFDAHPAAGPARVQ